MQNGINFKVHVLIFLFSVFLFIILRSKWLIHCRHASNMVFTASIFYSIFLLKFPFLVYNPIKIASTSHSMLAKVSKTLINKREAVRDFCKKILCQKKRLIDIKN